MLKVLHLLRVWHCLHEFRSTLQPWN